MSIISLDENIAQRRIETFERQYGKTAMFFASHASLPVAFNSGFIHLLRINFFMDPPEELTPATEADFLLSTLCREIGDNLYEMDVVVRNILLKKLIGNYTVKRARDVAQLLWEYTEESKPSPWSDLTRLERAQKLTVLNFLDPEKANEWLIKAETEVRYSGVSDEEDWIATMRVALKEVVNISNWDIQIPKNKSDIESLFDSFFDKLPKQYSISDKELIRRAYEIAEEAHRDQKRISGEPYINHCIATAQILAELNMPSEVVAAGLLHDTVEDTPITLADIRREFGDTIRLLVDGVTKLTHLPRVSRGDQHAENIENENTNANLQSSLLGRKEEMMSETLRKTFLAMGEDVRVVLIKLADRLHNMRTLSYMPEQKRKRIAQETLDIFAPLANRLGIWQIKWELEDLSFRNLQPDKYKEIANALAERRPDRENQIENIKQGLLRLLEKNNIKAEISGRPKHIYAIYKKMQKENKPFNMIYDVRAVRLIAPDVLSCYSALGVIHTTWRPIPGEFDDYIAAPKDNHYQSLHTAVMYDDKRPLEIQIRTQEMHMNAEYGIAANWHGQEGVKYDKQFEDRIKDLRKMMQLHGEENDAAEFVESMRADVSNDRIYIFTPRGDAIDLPAGSTPIDFAYHVHTDLGHRCRGARVNEKLVPLNTELKTGDTVEILTARRGGPSRNWLDTGQKFIHTNRARSKIKTWFLKQENDFNFSEGLTMLEKEIQKIGKTEIDYEKLAQELGFKVSREMFIALGNRELLLEKVVTLLSKI